MRTTAAHGDRSATARLAETRAVDTWATALRTPPERALGPGSGAGTAFAGDFRVGVAFRVGAFRAADFLADVLATVARAGCRLTAFLAAGAFTAREPAFAGACVVAFAGALLAGTRFTVARFTVARFVGARFVAARLAGARFVERRGGWASASSWSSSTIMPRRRPASR